MEESIQYCTNCKRDISVANYAIHSAFCERKIKLCKRCNEPVQIAEMEEHKQEYHAIVSCKECDICLEKWQLQKHMEECPKRLVVCKFCEAEFRFNEITAHNDFCGSRTEKCMFCKQFILLKDQDNHMQEECPKRLVVCEFCEEEVRFDEITEHNNFCDSRIEKCTFCKQSILLKDKSDHMQQHLYDQQVFTDINMELDEAKQNSVNEVINNNKGISEESSKLIYSKKEINEVYHHNIPKERKEINELNCQSIPKERIQHSYSKFSTTTGNSEKFSSNYLSECHICEKKIRWVDMHIHVPVCATASGRCSRCGDFVSDDDMKLHVTKTCRKLKNEDHSSACNMFVREEIYGKHQDDDDLDDVPIPTCPYCKIVYARDEILNHTRECPKNIHKCPYCLETMQLQTKTIHEDLECKVLIQARYGGHKESAGKSVNKDAVQRQNINSSGYDRSSQSSFPEHKHSYKEKKCDFCFETILIEDETLHLNFCPGLNKNQTFTVRHSPNVCFETKGAVPKNSSYEKQMPAIEVCEYCENQYNADILPFHKDQCIYKCRTCPACECSVPVKDAEHHIAKYHSGRGSRGRKKKASEKVSPKGKSGGSQSGNWFTRIWKGSEEKNSVYRGHHSYSSCVSGYPEYEARIHSGARYQSYVDNVTRNNLVNDDIPCEFCGKVFSMDEIVLHETGCEPELVSCAPEKINSLKQNSEKSEVLYARNDEPQSISSVSVDKVKSVPYVSPYKNSDRNVAMRSFQNSNEAFSITQERDFSFDSRQKLSTGRTTFQPGEYQMNVQRPVSKPEEYLEEVTEKDNIRGNWKSEVRNAEDQNKNIDAPISNSNKAFHNELNEEFVEVDFKSSNIQSCWNEIEQDHSEERSIKRSSLKLTNTLKSDNYHNLAENVDKFVNDEEKFLVVSDNETSFVDVLSDKVALLNINAADKESSVEDIDGKRTSYMKDSSDYLSKKIHVPESFCEDQMSDMISDDEDIENGKEALKCESKDCSCATHEVSSRMNADDIIRAALMRAQTVKEILANHKREVVDNTQENKQTKQSEYWQKVRRQNNQDSD